ncbi:MAG: DNA polymerase III subunit delta [Gammaproteobacteria bacterium]|nr:DNA polymerase III subunit delta [Gammaproteobacteria bacterium]
MRIYPDRLDEHLAGQLAAVYLISGDEPLQLGECGDAIRHAARAAGYTTRDVLEAGSGFDWQQLTAAAAAFSLFGDKKIIDLRIPGGKPGADGSRALSAYCEDPPPDTLLLLTLPKLDRQQPNSKWFKAIDRLGVTIQVWPIEAGRLPRWIEQRLRQAGIRPSRDAVRMLAERVEGNLLAACQEIDKLVLLHGSGPLDAEQLAAAVADSARYDVFELVDSALRGDAARAVHILDGLRGEGSAPSVVLWALHREIRTLAAISTDVAQGMSTDHAINRAKVFRKRTGLVRQGVDRLRTAQWLGLLDACHVADAAIKGVNRQSAWTLLERITLALCGQPRMTAAG